MIKSLNGNWQLYWQTEKTFRDGLTPDFKMDKFITAVVPGNVEIDLQRENILPDIYYSDNIFKVRHYETTHWWYRCLFDLPNDGDNNGIDLVFAGIDCYADIMLNGVQIGSATNMLIEHVFACGDNLMPCNNELIVHIRPAVLEARKFQDHAGQAALPTNFESLHTRKAPHMYGWDIMPRLVSAGIWRDVYLRRSKKEGIDAVYYATTVVDERKAMLLVKYWLRTENIDLSDLTIKISGRCGQSVFEKRLPVHYLYGQTTIDIDSPLLWWPKGYGQANLYDVTFELYNKDTLVDDATHKIGIRKVMLERTDTIADGQGKFVFKCNNVTIMAKGSNHVPLDALHSRDAQRLSSALGLYNDLGCNMIRCWGGNVYEDHAFFDYCDKNGIMVWQDFAFACAFYPQNQPFFNKISVEAESIIKKLRNHSSLVLWSGDNEIDICMCMHGLNPANNAISRRILPAIVAQNDPYRAYLPSSPYCCEKIVKTNDFDSASEQHLWGPRDYYKSPYYANNKACFISEMGYHGSPGINSLKKFISPQRLWPCEDNPDWFAHCTNPHPSDDIFKYRVKLMIDQIVNVFGFRPENLEDFIIASQITQAEALKYFIELTRSRKWRTGGILWWNLLDGWPQFSDAVVDYYYNKKLAYYYIKQSQMPVCLMINDPAEGYCDVVIANDTRENIQGRFKVYDADTNNILAEDDYSVTPNINRVVAKIDASGLTRNLLLAEYTVGQEKQTNHYLFGKPPIDFKNYRNNWLKKISNVSLQVDYRQIGQ